MFSQSELGRLGGLRYGEICLEKYKKSPKQCYHCKQILDYKKRHNKFCSRTCSGIFNNKNAKRDCKLKNCMFCSVKTKNQKFCSRQCNRDFNYKKYIENWLNGHELGYWPATIEIHDIIKIWIKKERGEQCEECGWNKINQHSGKIPLQIHHVDGNAKNCRPENLKLLCPNCHSLTSNFGGLNRGKGRTTRYKCK